METLMLHEAAQGVGNTAGPAASHCQAPLSLDILAFGNHEKVEGAEVKRSGTPQRKSIWKERKNKCKKRMRRIDLYPCWQLPWAAKGEMSRDNFTPLHVQFVFT